MVSSSSLGVLLGTLLVIASIPDATSYNKYGRTCKDIGCRSDEVCVMAEDPCSLYQPDNCGRYPTCAKSQPGKASCESTVCRENEYCKTENGVPTCVKKSNSIVPPPRQYPHGVPNRRVRPIPTTPPPLWSNGNRHSGASGSRNTIGSGSIYDRLFGNNYPFGSRGQPATRPRVQPGNTGYHTSHTSVDANGHRTWTFSG